MDDPSRIENNTCVVCGQTIKISIFKGTGVCSELHRKEQKRRRNE